MMRAVLVCVSILSPLATSLSPVFAQDAQYQDIHYTLDDIRLTAEVASNPKVSGELFIPETITVGQNTYTVTAIGDKAFKGCKALTAVVLPKTLERLPVVRQHPYCYRQDDQTAFCGSCQHASDSSRRFSRQ